MNETTGAKVTAAALANKWTTTEHSMEWTRGTETVTICINAAGSLSWAMEGKRHPDAPRIKGARALIARLSA